MILTINIIAFLAAFLLMEVVAWLAHKYLMHGLLWNLHRDHHTKETEGLFERNDFFFVIFATPGIILLYVGLEAGLGMPWFWMGLGITAYGFAYFLIHDVFIHQRLPWLRKTDSIYFRAIRKAHKIHHKKHEREGGSCFGMLWVAPKYFKEASRSSKHE